MNDERKAFEEWATDSAFNDFSTYDGEPFAYCNEFTDWAYRAWQARAALAGQDKGTSAGSNHAKIVTAPAGDGRGAQDQYGEWIDRPDKGTL
jgi:hypothetical protein